MTEIFLIRFRSLTPVTVLCFFCALGRVFLARGNACWISYKPHPYPVLICPISPYVCTLSWKGDKQDGDDPHFVRLVLLLGGGMWWCLGVAVSPAARKNVAWKCRRIKLDVKVRR